MFVLPHIPDIVLTAGADGPVFGKVEAHCLGLVQCINDHEDLSVAAVATYEMYHQRQRLPRYGVCTLTYPSTTAGTTRCR